ncbi:hypothetical protein [Noviherbaspirillum denitrificans]|uniref:hypothetical protein n=1 Tax=Noviherbaspirillum denitrificans TaxID=1968433 RepID=UPI0011321B5D|nr:hypothetical protein [Noviherbaspirillum denitrificans]
MPILTSDFHRPALWHAPAPLRRMLPRATRVLPLLATTAFAACSVLAAPDEQVLGKADNYPCPSNRQSYSTADHHKVCAFTHMEKLFDWREVKAGSNVRPLPPLESAPLLTYQYKGKTYTLDDFLDHQRVTGLLILKNGMVVAERYQYAREPHAFRFPFDGEVHHRHPCRYRPSRRAHRVP